jgi:phosphate-selective porin OprO/OprP
LRALAIGAGLLAAGSATGAMAKVTHHRPRPDPRDARIEALEQEVQALVQKVDSLESAEAQRAAAPAPPPPPVVAVAKPPPPPPAEPQNPIIVAVANAPPGGASIVAGRPSIQSADGRFTANLHAIMQFDAAYYSQAPSGPIASDLRRGATSSDAAHARDLNSGTDFRRARIGIDGKLFGDFEYNALFDFAGSGAEDGGHVQELWIQYSGIRPWHLKIGAFPPSAGLEDSNSTNGMPFLERPAISDMSRSLAGGDFHEAAQLYSNADRWFVSSALTTRLVGTINSTGSSTAQTFDQQIAYMGRAAFIPAHGDGWMTHVGVHGTYVIRPPDVGGPDVVAGRYPIQFRERAELRVDGTRLIDTGAIDAEHATDLGFEAAVQVHNVYVQGEYERLAIQRRLSALPDPHFHGWYIEGGMVLTGEGRRYNRSTFAFDAPTVDHPFDPKNGTFGALEAVLRYSDADLNYHPGAPGTPTPADGVRGGEQKIVAGGLNWYLNPVVRLMLDYQHVTIDRLSPNPTTFQTPVGAQIGQSFDTVSLRTQFAF